MSASEYPTSRAIESKAGGGPVLDSLARVSLGVGLKPLALRLHSVKRWLADEMKTLEQALLGGPSPINLAEQAAKYLLAQPGKRVRPLCVVLAARMGGRELDSVLEDIAVACELVHAATLLHDDVLDEGTERRNAPAARVVFGNSVSILAGDHLLLEALKHVQRAAPELTTSLLATISKMVDAEAIQLERRNHFSPDRETYLEVVDGKTAALFHWGLQAGGTLGGLSRPHIHALGAAGVSIGRVFQLVDDVLDFSLTSEATGKSVLSDLAQGKMTWPLIIASEREPGLAERINRSLSGTGLDSAELTQIAVTICNTGALEATRQQARLEADRAKSVLSALPKSRARSAIEAVITALVRRAS